MKALKIAAVVVGVVIAGVLVFILTFDANQYRGLAEEQARAATGREVTIGNIALAVSLAPTVVISDVSVGNASWGSRPAMATIQRLEASAQLIPLLSGDVRVSGVRVAGLNAILETDANGKGNWEFDVPGGASAADAGGSGGMLAISDLSAEGFNVAYRDRQNGVEADAAIGELDVSIDGPLEELNISRVRTTGAIVSFKDSGMAASAAVGSLDLRAEGPITALGITDIDLSNGEFSYSSGGDAMAGTLARLALNDAGALTLAGVINGEAVKASGTLAPVSALMARKSAIPAKLEIEAFGLEADTDVTVDFAASPIAVDGAVNVAALTLAPSTEPAGDRLFPADPLPWDALAASEGNVAVKVARITLPNGLELSNISLPVTLSGGRLAVQTATLDVAGGSLSADLAMNAADKSVVVKATASGLTAENLAKAMDATDLITNGPLDFAADVRGAGNSVQAVMATLNGSVVGGLGESRIRNDAMNMIGADVIMQVFNAVNPLANKDPYTITRCAVMNLQIAGGVARTERGIAMVTDKMVVTSSGNIDLGRERIDLSIRPQATSGLGVGLGTLTQMVKVSGSLSSPGVGIDEKGAVKALGSLGAAFATGGASLLAQGLKDRADTSSADACAEARVWHQAKQ